jgi:large subunit ribosomal protein L21
MYAVVQTGGKQYRVETGQTIRVERLEGDVGKKVEIADVLLVADGEKLAIGRPRVAGARVRAEIVKQGKERRLVIFNYRRRKRYRRKQGHRQPFTALKITAIEAG